MATIRARYRGQRCSIPPWAFTNRDRGGTANCSSRSVLDAPGHVPRGGDRHIAHESGRINVTVWLVDRKTNEPSMWQ